MKYYIVWNEEKTEGFITSSQSLAYDVRKSSDDNCYDESGDHSPVAEAFCNRWLWDNCTIEIAEND